MNNDKTEKELSIAPFVLMVLLIIGICIVFGFAALSYIDSWEHRGQFGDMFGALNTLFSGVAFAGVVYAIILQRRELAMQREEMRPSREELAAQNQLITAQLKTMQDSFRFELHKEDYSSEPVFRVHKASFASANMLTLEIVNIGGRITGLRTQVLIPSDGISIWLKPSDVWENNGKAVLELAGFGGGPCPDCKFELSYSDKLGREQTRVCQFLTQTNKLEVLPKKI